MTDKPVNKVTMNADPRELLRRPADQVLYGKAADDLGRALRDVVLAARRYGL